MVDVPSRPPFIGRGPERERLEALAARARAGNPSVALVSGDAGIGKTRLVEEWAADEGRRGAIVLQAGSPPVVGSGLPYAPITQLLRTVLRTHPDTMADANAPELRALVEPAGQAPARPTEPSTTVLSEQLLGVVTRLAAAGDLVVLVFEDLHWADVGSLDLLGYLLRNLRDDRVMTVATFRGAGDLPAQTASLVTELGRAGAERLPLRALDAADVEQHVRAIAGSTLPPEAVAQVVRLSDGNPFFAEELAAGMASGAGLSLTAQEMIRAGIDRLPTEARHVLRLASVAGRRVRTALLWHGAGLDEDAAAQAIRRLQADRYLVPAEGPSGDLLVVRQALVRELVYDELLGPERARYHAAVARVLTAAPDLGAGSPVETAIETALHWRAAGDRIRAFPALVKAAEAAEQVYAFGEADRLYRAALELAAPADTPRETRPMGFHQAAPAAEDGMTAVWRRAAEAASLAGDPRRAAELAEQAIDRTGAGDASLLAALGRYRLESGEPDVALDAFARALATTTDTTLRTRALIGRARALLASGRQPEALSASLEARAAATELGRPTEQSQALSVLAVAQVATGSRDDALRTLDEARSLANRHRSASVIRPRPSRVTDLMATFGDAASLLRAAGRRDEALAAAEAGAVEAERYGAERSAARLRLAAAENLFDGGRWNEALEAASAVAQATRDLPLARILRARILALRGVFDPAEDDLAAVEPVVALGDDASLAAAFHLALGELHYGRRRLAEADESVQAALGRGGRRLSVVERAELCELGVRAAAERHAEARAMRKGTEQAFADAVAALVAEMEILPAGGDARADALLATARAEAGRTTGDADGPWRAALSAWESVGDPYRAAYARFRLVEAALGARVARGGAESELRAAYATALALEAAPLLQEIRLLAQRARLDLEPATPDAPTQPPAESSPGEAAARSEHGLSVREIEVLRLVAAGRTNRQIAEELFITEKTASHHVSNILMKLDVASRVEAAGMAHRMGLAAEG